MKYDALKEFSVSFLIAVTLQNVTICLYYFQIFLKVASNIHDGSGGLRQIQYDDVTDRGQYAARTRSASARSVEARTIFLPDDQRKVLGMTDNLDDEDEDNNYDFGYNDEDDYDDSQPCIIKIIIYIIIVFF